VTLLRKAIMIAAVVASAASAAPAAQAASNGPGSDNWHDRLVQTKLDSTPIAERVRLLDAYWTIGTKNRKGGVPVRFVHAFKRAQDLCSGACGTGWTSALAHADALEAYWRIWKVGKTAKDSTDPATQKAIVRARSPEWGARIASLLTAFERPAPAGVRSLHGMRGTWSMLNYSDEPWTPTFNVQLWVAATLHRVGSDFDRPKVAERAMTDYRAVAAQAIKQWNVGRLCINQDNLLPSSAYNLRFTNGHWAPWKVEAPGHYNTVIIPALAYLAPFDASFATIQRTMTDRKDNLAQSHATFCQPLPLLT
jgi:hypothetical protein